MSGFWERQWYSDEHSRLLGAPLAIASLGFTAAVRVRELLPPRALRIEGARVVSVGNLTVGGSGKTPVVIFLASWAARCGKKVAVLSRGYGRKTRADLRFDAANLLPAEEVGDEPRLIARRCPQATVWGGSDRASLALKARETGADFLLLDDGMQHRRLARDADIVVVDALAGFGNGRLLPAGPLREPVEALSRATVAWLRQTGAPAHELEAALKLAPRRVVSRPQPIVPPIAGPVLALAGLARTRGFMRTLSDLGAQVVAERFFPDHHAFSAAELDEVLRTARALNAKIVTTEKDLQRLPDHFEVTCVRIDEQLVAGRDVLADHLGLDPRRL
jgi:tetraacyldisaccharide 4'-kinase